MSAEARLASGHFAATRCATFPASIPGGRSTENDASVDLSPHAATSPASDPKNSIDAVISPSTSSLLASICPRGFPFSGARSTIFAPLNSSDSSPLTVIDDSHPAGAKDPDSANNDDPDAGLNTHAFVSTSTRCPAARGPGDHSSNGPEPRSVV